MEAAEPLAVERAVLRMRVGPADRRSNLDGQGARVPTCAALGDLRVATTVVKAGSGPNGRGTGRLTVMGPREHGRTVVEPLDRPTRVGVGYPEVAFAIRVRTPAVVGNTA